MNLLVVLHVAILSTSFDHLTWFRESLCVLKNPCQNNPASILLLATGAASLASIRDGENLWHTSTIKVGTCERKEKLRNDNVSVTGGVR